MQTFYKWFSNYSVKKCDKICVKVAADALLIIQIMFKKNAILCQNLDFFFSILGSDLFYMLNIFSCA